ncbi:metallophosphoesterase [Chlorobium phaeobacteroides DSM 266]|uniref:Metallophosphoesterase n=2 Tax=Chlorobium phaeobacteroides TaxID=1096 RepID=A1BG96_CHLPD|nr:metallophosphoesterase [Chlorobium phaeobacteroides DSM 266]
MKIAVIHFSDIHFKEGLNSIMKKRDKLFEAIRNEVLECKGIFIVISGDVAFSGKATEYDIAKVFIDDIVVKLKGYSDRKVDILIVPGNHDCNFVYNNQARSNQINIIQRLGESVIDDSVIDQCVEVQKEFYLFRKKIQPDENLVHENKIISIYDFEICGKVVSFHCYNTAYMSEIHEENGKLFYSIDSLPSGVFQKKTDLVISIFHHPFHCFNPTNRRDFSTHINKTSDFYLTGHEHQFSGEKIEDLNGNIVYHLEGSVLQNSENIFESEYSVIKFDLDDEVYSASKYVFENDMYKIKFKHDEWVNYKRGRNKVKLKYSLTDNFCEILKDAGGKFRHPSKSNITLYDVYVYPNLKNIIKKTNLMRMSHT